MIKAVEFARRRKQLMRMADDDAIIILPSAPLRVRSHDTHFPYRQDSDFWYLSGFPEPEAVLVLVPGRKHGEALLFCRERDLEREGWDGPRFGPEGAVEAFGMAAVIYFTLTFTLVGAFRLLERRLLRHLRPERAAAVARPAAA